MHFALYAIAWSASLSMENSDAVEHSDSLHGGNCDGDAAATNEVLLEVTEPCKLEQWNQLAATLEGQMQTLRETTDEKAWDAVYETAEAMKLCEAEWYMRLTKDQIATFGAVLGAMKGDGGLSRKAYDSIISKSTVAKLAAETDASAAKEAALALNEKTKSAAVQTAELEKQTSQLEADQLEKTAKAEAEARKKKKQEHTKELQESAIASLKSVLSAWSEKYEISKEDVASTEKAVLDLASGKNGIKKVADAAADLDEKAATAAAAATHKKTWTAIANTYNAAEKKARQEQSAADAAAEKTRKEASTAANLVAALQKKKAEKAKAYPGKTFDAFIAKHELYQLEAGAVKCCCIKNVFEKPKSAAADCVASLGKKQGIKSTECATSSKGALYLSDCALSKRKSSCAGTTWLRSRSKIDKPFFLQLKSGHADLSAASVAALTGGVCTVADLGPDAAVTEEPVDNEALDLERIPDAAVAEEAEEGAGDVPIPWVNRQKANDWQDADEPALAEEDLAALQADQQ